MRIPHRQDPLGFLDLSKGHFPPSQGGVPGSFQRKIQERTLYDLTDFEVTPHDVGCSSWSVISVIETSNPFKSLNRWRKRRGFQLQ